MRLVVLAAIVAAVAVASASAASTAFKNCGTVKSGGATWSVVAAGGVSCTAAKPLIRKLAKKPHPSPGTPLGTYLGLKCVEFAGNGKREIACTSIDGRKSVFGVTPPKK
jgi:hypothetical protein